MVACLITGHEHRTSQKSIRNHWQWVRRQDKLGNCGQQGESFKWFPWWYWGFGGGNHLGITHSSSRGYLTVHHKYIKFCVCSAVTCDHRIRRLPTAQNKPHGILGWSCESIPDGTASGCHGSKGHVTPDALLTAAGREPAAMWVEALWLGGAKVSMERGEGVERGVGQLL